MSAVPNKPRQSSTPTVCASFSGGPLYTCPLNSRKTFPGRQILFPINLYCKSHDMSSSLQNLHFDQSQWKCLRHFNRSFPTHERAPWPPSVPFFRMQICFQQKLQSSTKFFLVLASHQQSSTKFFWFQQVCSNSSSMVSEPPQELSLMQTSNSSTAVPANHYDIRT